MRILGGIIAGGASSRMGQEKALLKVNGVTLVERVLLRLERQVDDVVLNANGDVSRFKWLGKHVIADHIVTLATPLAGLHAVLRHAAQHGFSAAVTVPSDTPFLPLDLVERLAKASARKGAAIAMSKAQPHFITGIWTVGLLQALEDRIEDGSMRRVKDFAYSAEAERVVWSDLPHDPFFNINTPQDLQEAETIAKGILP